MQTKYTRYDFLINSLDHLPLSDDCLLWPYGLDAGGYGSVYDPTRKKPERVHRIAFERAIAPLDSIPILQTCGHRPCYRPSHLRRYKSQTAYLIASVNEWNGSDTCLEWPFSRHKPLPYGRVYIAPDQPEELAHRLSYRTFIGPIPDGLDILHGCDNPPCYNPKHLRPGNDSDNQQDCVARGRRPDNSGELNPMHRLSEEQIAELHEMRAGGASVLVIADALGISFQHANDILRGNRWRKIPGRPFHKLLRCGDQATRHKLTTADVLEIHRMNRAEGLHAPTIAKRFGVSREQAWSILTFKSWKHIKQLIDCPEASEKTQPSLFSE